MNGMPAPAISVLMPCHNCAAHVEEALQSVLAQTFDDWELIVVDDGSRDDSAARIAACEDPRIRLIRQDNAGVSAARNRAIAAARGARLAFLDADDWWAPTLLERLSATLDEQPDAVAAYCGWQNVGLPGGAGEPYVPPDYEAGDRDAHLLKACPWPIHAVLTSAEAVREAGGFDEALATSEDYALWLEVAARGRLVRVPEVLAFSRHHGGGQATANRARLARDQYGVQTGFLARHPEVAERLGPRRARDIICTGLRRRTYEAYWDRDLEASRDLFRLALARGCLRPADLRHALPSLLPRALHARLLAGRDRRPA